MRVEAGGVGHGHACPAQRPLEGALEVAGGGEAQPSPLGVAAPAASARQGRAVVLRGCAGGPCDEGMPCARRPAWGFTDRRASVNPHPRTAAESVAFDGMHRRDRQQKAPIAVDIGALACVHGDPRPHPAGFPPRSRAGGIHAGPPAQPRPLRGGGQPLRPGPHDLDEHVDRWLPALPRQRAGQPHHRRRRAHVHRLRARRHRRDGGPLPRADGRSGDAADGRARRHHHDAADRGRAVGGRGADPPLRAAAVVLHALRDRRQPLGDPPRPAGDRPAQDPGLRLLLPRLGRRGVRAARSRRQDREPARATSLPRSTST